MKKIIFLFLFIISSISFFGQEKDWRLYDEQKTTNNQVEIIQPESDPGEITLVQSVKLDSLLAVLEANPPKLKGFRVRIYMGTSRENADEIRSIYLKNEYQWPHYLSFRDPNFVVEIGDFMTRLQAESVKEQLSVSFSNPYIVLTGIQPIVEDEKADAN